MKTIIIILVLLSWLPGLLAEPVRVALLPMDAAAQNLADLALAELSGDAGMAFLERAEIDQIKRELRLSALSDFVPDPQLMQNVNVFAVVLNNDFVAFDARTGVRLVDVPAIGVETVGGALRDAIAKRQSLTENRLRKLSGMPIVSANLSESQEALARRLEASLLRTLGNQKDFVVLERRHLLLLLNEPGAERHDLTRDLFAGALVLKLTATPEGRDGVRLKLHFFSPDGKTLLSEKTGVFQAGADLDEQCRQFLSTLPIPEDTPEDKSGEARNFIYEAWFSVSHSLTGDAIASATSASALDAEQEKELCRIAAKASRQLWQQWTKPPAERYAVATANLKLAARLAARHRIFPYELRLAMGDGAALPSQRDFAKLPANLQRELREIVESLLETRRDTLAECRRLAELSSENWHDRLFALEARCEYLRELAAVAEIQWDYGYWDRYVYPELAKYVAEVEDLLPEVHRYNALSNVEKITICRQAQNKKRRLPRYRQHLELSVVHRDLTRHFYRFRPDEHDDANVAIYKKTMALLAASKILPLAYQGRFGFLRLRFGVPFLEALNTTLNRAQPADRTALREFYRDLVELFATAESVDSPQNIMGNLTDVFSDSADLDYRLPIQELAMRRFAWYTPWQGDLIKGSQQWRPEERQAVHRQLSKYIEEYNRDPRLERERQANRSTADRYFRRLQEQLEKQDQGLSPAPPEMAAIDPFERVIAPLEDNQTDLQPIVFGEEGGVIYLGEYHSDSVRIVRVDTRANLAVSKGPKHKLPISWHGWKVHGVILANYLAAQNDGSVFLFPKDGTPPECIDFSHYVVSRCHAMVGCGDRLFLSFDGEHGHPGTVLEYNVTTKKTKLLVSTLDRSVKWPLQGLPEPYAITSLLCDPPRQRLIMLMHDQPPVPGRVAYTIRFQAYYWETETWQAVSRLLPITNTSSFNSFYLENGELWLLTDNGLGKINAGGDWQPALLLDGRRRFSTQLPNFGPEFAAVTVDYSQCGAYAQKHQDLTLPDVFFNHYGGSILFAQNLLVFVPEKTIVSIASSFPVALVAQGGYVIGGRTHDYKSLRIGVLKDRKELLKRGKP